MIKIKFWSFEKKHNSTAVPGDNLDYSEVEGVIKADCSITSPSVDIMLPQDSTNFRYMTYAYIESFARYYFVTDWRWNGRLWTCSMSVDVLASYKPKILDASEFVLRSAYIYNDYIIDNALPTTAQQEMRFSANMIPESYRWQGDLEDGTYVLGIVNSSEDAVGAVAYYKFTPAQVRVLCNKMLGSSTYLAIDTDVLEQGIQEALVNPWQYIVSCMWYPFDVASGDSVSAITIGWWSFDIPCTKIASWGYSFAQLKFAVLKHPKYQYNGRYLALQPFSTYELFVPGFGTHALPAGYMVDADTILCDIVTDSISGSSTMTVYRNNSDGGEICKITAQVGVPIQLASMSYKPIASAIMSGIGLASSLTGTPLVYDQGIGGILARFGMGIADQNTTISTAGSTGNLSQFHYPPFLKHVFVDQPDIPSNDMGRPLCRRIRLGDLHDYTVCEHGDINISCTDGERQSIKSFLEGGFYIE